MMMDRKTIEGIRARYPKGTQVRLVQMDDVQAPLQVLSAGSYTWTK